MGARVNRFGWLIPADVQGRTRVVQWCFAATSKVERTLGRLDMIAIFDSASAAPMLKSDVRKIARHWLEGIERRLVGREWIACTRSTVADIKMAGVLRGARKTDLMDPFRAPRTTARAARRAQPGSARLLSRLSGSVLRSTTSASPRGGSRHVMNPVSVGRPSSHSDAVMPGVVASRLPRRQTCSRVARKRIASTGDLACSSTKLASQPGSMP